MPNETVVITGAHGFLGRHLSRYYSRQGWRVVGIGHGLYAAEDQVRWGLTEWHSCDVTLEALQEHAGSPSVILHFAGGSSIGRSLKDPREDFRRTVDTTLDVLEFVRLKTPHTRVVFPSSAAVYGAVPDSPISEAAPLNPISPYGAHKRAAEGLCSFYATVHGLRVAILRLFSVYGIGLRKQLLWDACTKATRGETTFGGTGSETRDWLHVEDGVELGFLAGTRASAQCPVVNGGTGIGVEVREVLAEVFAQFGREDRPVFSGENRPGDPRHYRADIASASGWGWRPKVSWRDGVREYVRWYRREPR